MSHINKIIEMARREIKRIVLPEVADDRILKAAAKTLEMGFARIILPGNEAELKKRAAELNINIDDAEFVEPATAPGLEKYVQEFYEIRKEKGMTLEEARETVLNDTVYFGVLMLRAGDADGLVSGADHTTADTLRPALQILRYGLPQEQLRKASSFMIVDVPDCEFGEDGLFMFADCGFNQDPSSELMADIAYDCTEAFRVFIGDDPRIAFISHSTKGSAKHDMVDKVREAVRIAHEKYPGLKCDGEMQVDAAIVPEIGEIKAPDSEVAGRANFLIFPNIDAGNACYKIAERLAKADVYGPLIQGLPKPVNDLSRGVQWESIPGVIAITAVQAQCKRNH